MSTETWTPERVEQLRTFVSTGLSCSRIAAEIGVTRNAVIGKIHRLGLSPGRGADASAGSCPPRARRPHLPTQRQALRLISAEAPCIGEEPGTGVIESAQRCSLLELAQGKCRWPVGHAGEADFAFCGNDALRGFSYCVGHARMAYRSTARRA